MHGREASDEVLTCTSPVGCQTWLPLHVSVALWSSPNLTHTQIS